MRVCVLVMQDRGTGARRRLQGRPGGGALLGRQGAGEPCPALQEGPGPSLATSNREERSGQEGGRRRCRQGGQWRQQACTHSPVFLPGTSSTLSGVPRARWLPALPPCRPGGQAGLPRQGRGCASRPLWGGKPR